MSERGSATWAAESFGARCSADDQKTIKFFGRDRVFHRGTTRHFKRLDRIFKERAPKYHRRLCLQPDVYSYSCRVIAGTQVWSLHSWPIAADLDSAENARGVDEFESLIWREAKAAVRRAEVEGFRWGGRYTSPDAMHFETLLTPAEQRRFYTWRGKLKRRAKRKIKRDGRLL